MKIKDEEIVSEKSGEFRGNKFGINEENMHMVIQAFQKSIYSNPIGSIVREIASNCVDSHIESGQTRPIEIEYREKNSLTGAFESVIFRDFGVGISPERMENIFCNYFSSTKRDSNNQIGGFGIGAKSPFSYTDTFYIKTVHDGKEYNYIAYKEQQGDRIDMVSDPVDTTGVNGTEIIVPIKKTDDRYLFQNEIKKQLLYFQNVKYINLEIPKYEVLYECDEFLVSNQSEFNQAHLLIGRVAYPIDFRILENVDEPNCSVAYKINIGDISVAINREVIQYDDATKDFITGHIKKSSEVAAIYVEDSLKTETDFFNFLYKGFQITKGSRYNRATEIIEQMVSISNTHDYDLKFQDTLDIDFGNFQKVFDGLLFHRYTASNYGDNKKTLMASTHNMGYGIFNMPIYYCEEKLSAKKNLALIDAHPDGYIVVKNNGPDALANNPWWCAPEVTLEERVDSQASAWQLIKQYGKSYEEFVYNPEDYALIDDENGFVDLVKQRKLQEKVFVKELAYEASLHQIDRMFAFKQTEYKIKDLVDYDGLLIYGFKDDDEALRELGGMLCCINKFVDYNGFNTSKIKILKVAQTIEKHLVNHIYYEDFIMHTHDVLKQWYTSQMIEKDIENLDYLHGFSTFNKNIYDKYQRLKGYTKVYSSRNNPFRDSKIEASVVELCKEHNIVNKEMLEFRDEVVDYCNGLNMLSKVRGLSHNDKSDGLQDEITEYLLLKGKAVDVVNTTDVKAEGEEVDEELEVEVNN